MREKCLAGAGMDFAALTGGKYLFAGYAADMFRLVLASLHNETAAGPGMFTLLPEDGKWLKVQGKRRYSAALSRTATC